MDVNVTAASLTLDSEGLPLLLSSDSGRATAAYDSPCSPEPQLQLTQETMSLPQLMGMEAYAGLLGLTPRDGQHDLSAQEATTLTLPEIRSGQELRGTSRDPNSPGRHGVQLGGLNHPTPSRHSIELGEQTNRNREEAEWDTKIAGMFEMAFKGLAEAIRPNPAYVVLPQYEGSDWEDPAEFIEKIRKVCIERNIPKEDWATFAANRLCKKAYRWYEHYRDLQLSFEDFVRCFLGEFDSTETRSRLQAKLYGERQGLEGVVVFINRKVALMRRFAAHMLEEERVCVIKALLAPEIRINLRASEISTVDKLLQITAAIEMDLAEIRHGEELAEARKTMERKPVVASAPRPSPRRLAIEQRPEITEPPYPCRYCGNNHFHKDCSQRPTTVVPGRPLALPGPRNPGNAMRTAGNQEPAP